MALTIIGLGVEKGDISLRAIEKIKTAEKVVLRTKNTDSASSVLELCDAVSLDYVYEKSRNFQTLNKNIVKEIKALTKQYSSVCYLVDGAVSEDYSAKELIKTLKGVEVIEGASKASNALARLGLCGEGATSVSAYEIENFSAFSYPLIVYDLDSYFLASLWKIKLTELIGEEQKVSLYIDKRVISIPVYELDRQEGFDYSTVLIVENSPLKDKTRFYFDDLFEIIKILRGENGCPWDRVQTKESIKKDLVEECYELIDAINKNDEDKMLEEIGDVILQAVFHLTLAEEREAFSRYDVLSALCEKLIFRHSHIFGGDSADSAETALDVWNKNKQIEKGFDTVYSYVSDVPECLPSLIRAEKVLKRQKRSNFNVLEPTLKDLTSLLEQIENTQSADKLFGEFLLLLLAFVRGKVSSCEESLYDAIMNDLELLKSVEEDLMAQGFNLKDCDKELVKKAYEKRKKS